MSKDFCIISAGIDDEGILKAVHEAVNYFENGVEKFNFVDIPINAHNKVRDQYRAASFLRIAERWIGKKNVIITDVDIYTSCVDFVFGQAFLNGNACVISTHRLNPQFYANDGGCNNGTDDAANYQMLIERVKKETIHEIGHTFGLHHCDNSRCVMSFSPGIEEVDAKCMDLCEKCSERLRSVF